MKRFRAAFAMLALCLLTAIDPRPSFAETYRPWCVQYPTSDATSCAFHLIRTMHDDGGPRNRRRLRAEPMVIYGTASTASAPGVRVAGPGDGKVLRRCAGGEVKPRQRGD